MEETTDKLCIEMARKACADEGINWKLVYEGKIGRIWVKPSTKCDFHSIKVNITVDYASKLNINAGNNAIYGYADGNRL